MDMNLLRKFDIVGIFEYNCIQDTMSLCTNCSRIYFGDDRRDTVSIDEVFSVLTTASSQYLSQILANSNQEEIACLQKVFQPNGNIKDVLAILKPCGDRVYGMVVDISSSYRDTADLY